MGTVVEFNMVNKINKRNGNDTSEVAMATTFPAKMFECSDLDAIWFLR